MRKRILRLMVSMMAGYLVLFGGTQVALADSGKRAIEETPEDCGRSFLGMRPWFQGLTVKDEKLECRVGTVKHIPTFVTIVTLNVLFDLFLILGYVVLGRIIYVGVLYIMSEGNPAKIQVCKQILTSSVIGLVIVTSASLIVYVILQIIQAARA